ncbi:MAG: FMN-binding protein [Flavobacteriaceae bacterium]
MNFERRLIGVLLVISFFITGFGLPSNIEKRMKKEVAKFYKTADFSMATIKISNNLNASLPTQITDNNFFSIKKNDSITLGYAFLGQARSKTAKFDYLVIFDKGFSIVHAKVLAYREEYGGEIGSRRWLKQFLGKTGRDRVSNKSNIDGISGATISVRSMTMSIDDLLQTIGILQDNNAL